MAQGTAAPCCPAYSGGSSAAGASEPRQRVATTNGVVTAMTDSAGFFWAGQVMGYDQAEETSQAMGLAILLDVMVALLSLIWGLVSLKEPEQY